MNRSHEKKWCFFKTPLLLLTALLLFGLAQTAAALDAVGAVDPGTAFPLWYEDQAGLRLQLCDVPGDAEAPPCLPELVNPANGFIQGNIIEALYYAAVAQFSGPGGESILAQCVVEAAADGGVESVTNAALIRLQGFNPAGTYTIETPCGTFTDLTPDATGEIRAENPAIGVLADGFSGALGADVPVQLFASNGTGGNVLAPGVFLGDGVNVGPLSGPLQRIGLLDGPTAVTVTGTDAFNATSSDFLVVGKVSGCTADNEAPTAVDDFAATKAGTAVVINVLANDSDVVVSDPTTVPPTTEVITPPVGTLTIVPDSLFPVDSGTLSVTGNSITFTPAADFTGPASFEYTVTDPCGEISNTATVTVLVEDLQFNQADLRVRTGKWAINGTSSFSDLIVELSLTETAYVTGLFGAQEVPAPVTSAASGDFTAIFDSAVPAAFNYDLTVNVPEGTTFTRAHIHAGVAGVNGGVLFTLCDNQADPIVLPCTVTNGVISLSGTLTAAEFQTVGDITTFVQAVTAIQTGGTYVNVHSVAVPSGEVRGQIGRNVISLRAGIDGPAIGAAEVQDDLSWGINGKLNVSPGTSSTIEAESGLGNTETRELRLR